jgi:hypothetical protein
MELLEDRLKFRVTERYAFHNDASVPAHNPRVVQAVERYMVRAQRRPVLTTPRESFSR